MYGAGHFSDRSFLQLLLLVIVKGEGKNVIAFILARNNNKARQGRESYIHILRTLLLLDQCTMASCICKI